MSVDCINESVLIVGKQAGRHAWPEAENDKSETIAQNQSSARLLEDGRME